MPTGIFLKEKTFFGIIVLFCLFRTLCQKNSTFWWTFFLWIWQNAILSVRGKWEKLGEKYFFLRKLFFSIVSDNEQTNFCLLKKNVCCGCQNCNLPVHGNILMTNTFFWKIWFSHIFFGHWANKFQQFVENLIGSVVKFGIYVSNWKTWRKKCFSFEKISYF